MKTDVKRLIKDLRKEADMLTKNHGIQVWCQVYLQDDDGDTIEINPYAFDLKSWICSGVNQRTGVHKWNARFLRYK